MKIICDKCESDVTIKMEWYTIKDDLRQEYFKCQKCGTTYDVAKTTKKVRELQKKLKTADKGKIKGITKELKAEMVRASDKK